MAFDFNTCSFVGSSLDLSNRHLDDDDIARLVILLSEHPNITVLDLRNNNIGARGAQLLAANTTLRTLRLQGNASLTQNAWDLFLRNHTLTTFPVFGSGPKVCAMRAHIKQNANPIVVAAAPVDAAPAVVDVVPVLEVPEAVVVEVVVKEAATALLPPVPIVEAEVLDLEERSHDLISGEQEFQFLLAAASLDVSGFNLPINYLIWYMAIALNLYLHNASYTPVAGFGLVQKLEAESPLFYNRSQLGHPHQARYEMLTKEKTDGRNRAYLPFNPEFRRMLSASVLDRKLEADLAKLDDRTFLRSGKTLSSSFFGVFLGSSGARRNNHSIYTEGMWYVVRKEKRAFIEEKAQEFGCVLHPNAIAAMVGRDATGLARSLQINIDKKLRERHGTRLNQRKIDQLAALDLTQWETEIATRSHAALQNKFQAIIVPQPLTRDIARLPAGEVTKRVTAILDRFQTLHDDLPTDYAGHHNLQRAIYDQRQHRLDAIVTQTGDRAHLVLKKVGGSCLHICLKGLSNLEGKTEDYQKRFTNAVLAFFCGLLNYHAKQRGRSIHIDLRQSFGFYRPTLAELGPLTLRLSLGLEPAYFNEIVVTALTELNAALDAYIAYPVTAVKMKSENQINDGPLAAEHYLEQAATTTEALQNFITGYAAVTRKPHYNLAERSKPPGVRRKRPLDSENRQSTVLFSLLEKTLHYAVNKAVNGADVIAEESPLSQLKHSYWHTLNKLYQHCKEARDFLRNIESYGETYAYRLANGYLEKILEYVIVLDSLFNIQRSMLGDPTNPVRTLTHTEKAYAVRSLGVADDLVEVYFADSGQQAIVASVLAMDLHFYPEGGSHDHSLYTFEESYYEFEGFLEKSGGLRIPRRGKGGATTQKNIATIAFVDVTRVDLVNLDEMSHLRALVIDISRNPDLNNTELQATIAAARTKGLWIVLAASCLKHEELGLDKYQAGKVITIAPTEDEAIRAGVVDEELGAISAEAMRDPAVASYLQMANEIYGDKFSAEPLVTDVAPTATISAEHSVADDLGLVGLFRRVPTEPTISAITRNRRHPLPS